MTEGALCLIWRETSMHLNSCWISFGQLLISRRMSGSLRVIWHVHVCHCFRKCYCRISGEVSHTRCCQRNETWWEAGLQSIRQIHGWMRACLISYAGGPSCHRTRRTYRRTVFAQPICQGSSATFCCNRFQASVYQERLSCTSPFLLDRRNCCDLSHYVFCVDWVARRGGGSQSCRSWELLRNALISLVMGCYFVEWNRRVELRRFLFSCDVGSNAPMQPWFSLRSEDPEASHPLRKVNVFALDSWDFSVDIRFRMRVTIPSASTASIIVAASAFHATVFRRRGRCTAQPDSLVLGTLLRLSCSYYGGWGLFHELDSLCSPSWKAKLGSFL